VGFGVRPGLYAANFGRLLGLALLIVVARAQVLRAWEYQADARVLALCRAAPRLHVLRWGLALGLVVGTP
jgi:hypothetical protein